MKDRRQLLEAIGIAGATGAIWNKPVVNAVMLPSHAVTSCDDTGWILGDGEGSSETQVGTTATRCDCETLVKIEEPTADGATWHTGDGGCYAEFEWAVPDNSDEWHTKSLSTSCDISNLLLGDSGSGSETLLGDGLTLCQCQVLAEGESGADGLTWKPLDGDCYAEFNWSDPGHYESKGFNS